MLGRMTPRRRALVEHLSDYSRLLEIGIGRRPEVAADLVAHGADVRSTDVDPVDVPDGVRFRVEDVLDVDSDRLSEFHRVDAVYALNCPPDLHRPILQLALAVDAPFLFTTLGYDEPTVPVDRRMVGPETLYVADPTHPAVRRVARRSDRATR